MLRYFSNSTGFQLVAIICSTLAVSSSGNRSLRKAYYGSSCNSTIKCDIHSLLMCEENVCQCLYPDAMTYNSDLGTCLSLVNEICGYLETKRVFINCVPNASCDQQQGVCKCSQGYVEAGRQCIEQKGYGEQCHSDNECLSDLSLTCFEEICQCDPKRYAVSEEESDLSLMKRSTKCVTLAGLPCNMKTGCVKKASCVREGENDGRISSTAYGWLASGICKCDEGYEMSEDGFCRGKYGSYCDVVANISCGEMFHCLDGICQCKYPDDQHFQIEMSKCVSLVGGPCTMESNGTEGETTERNGIVSAEVACDKFMVCSNYTCTCSKGFVENPERQCHLSYGQMCTAETMSKCDSAGGLHCVNGRCACKDIRKVYDTKAGKCVGLRGSPCKLDIANIGTGRRDENVNGMLPCSDNTKCQVSRAQLEGIAQRGFCSEPKGGLRKQIEQQHLYLGHTPTEEIDDY